MSELAMAHNKPDRKRCTAKSKRTGKQCGSWALIGFNVCRIHGALGGAPKGSKNALKYGTFSNDLQNEEEKEIYLRFYEALREDFQLNDSSDVMAGEMACMFYIRLKRAIDNNDQDNIPVMESLIRNQLKDLKATKDRREGEIISVKTTPAEWAANLLAKYREEKAKTDKTEKNSHICEKKSDASD
ncbi:MAG: hypothetical protein ACE5GM_11380 [bacterium]